MNDQIGNQVSCCPQMSATSTGTSAAGETSTSTTSTSTTSAGETLSAAGESEPEPPRQPEPLQQQSKHGEQHGCSPPAGPLRSRTAQISVEIIQAAGEWTTIDKARDLIHAAAAQLAAHECCLALLYPSPLAASHLAQPPQSSPAVNPGTPLSLSLSIALSDDTEIQELNKRFRGQDKPTNVLSFPALDALSLPDVQAEPVQPAPQDHDQERYLGDIILAHSTICREARAQGKSAAAHMQHLVIHGILHLLGYDHITDEEADAMEAIEIELLANLQIANPYSAAIEGAIDE